MNVILQVCNHPDLFERQETRSPFHMSMRPFVLPKFLYRHGLLQSQNRARNKYVLPQAHEVQLRSEQAYLRCCF